MQKLEEMQYIWKDRKRILGMPLSFTRYRLSEDRLFHSNGLLTTTEEEILLYRVQDLTVRISLGQRVFGVGTVIVKSSDPSQPVLELRNVRRPRAVKELLHRHVELMKEQRGVRASELVGSQGVPHGHSDVDIDGDGIPDVLVCDPPQNP